MLNDEKKQLRAQASISILNSLLETTQHSVVESLAIKDIYAKAAVLYADALVDALELDHIELKTIMEEIKKKFK